MTEPHYLKRELYDLVQSDSAIFEFLQRGSLDGIWYWDLTDANHEWMSERFWETFGHDPATKKHLASEWQDMIHPDDLPLALANFEKHCADPDFPYDQVVRYRHADGSMVWVRCRGLVIRDADGTPIRMLGAHTDLTREKGIEASLSKAAVELRRSNEDLERFAYIASHDLQQPLRTVRGFVELLRDRIEDDLDDKSLGYMNHVVDAVEHMQRLIDELLSLSRVGSKGIKRERVSLRSAVDQALLNLTDAVERSGATLTVGSLPTVVGDPTLLTRLIQNLVDNAIKYRADDRPLEVTVSGQATPGGWQVSVRDTGKGIDPKFRERIFQLFRQLQPSQKSTGGGVGVGLTTARKIARLHGGDLTVSSQLGVGSTFTFTLRTPEP